jgi:hypothetical protein
MSKRNIKQSYNRILEVSEDAKQITMPDSRYYRRNGKYYPSITYVLSAYPKGKFFEDWLKKVGYSSEFIVKKDLIINTFCLIYNCLKRYNHISPNIT